MDKQTRITSKDVCLLPQHRHEIDRLPVPQIHSKMIIVFRDEATHIRTLVPAEEF